MYMLKQKDVVYLQIMCQVPIILFLFLVSCNVPTKENNHQTSPVVIPSPIPTYTQAPLTPIATPTPTRLSDTETSPEPTEIQNTPIVKEVQMEENIPTCLNFENPTPFSNLPSITGILFYSGLDQGQLFSFSGFPPQSMPIVLPNTNIDSYAFAPDGKWLLAYSRVPEEAPCYKCKPFTIWLISKDGFIESKTIDIAEMIEFVHDGRFDTASFQNLKLEWVNAQIVKVAVGFGEFGPKEYI